MPGVVADTHAFVWYLLDRPRLSPAALKALNQVGESGHPVSLSAISILEITCLVEKGRLPSPLLERVYQKLIEPSVALSVIAVDTGVARAVAGIQRAEVPDMPDRIIAATALHLGLPLVTRDARIPASAVTTIW